MGVTVMVALEQALLRAIDRAANRRRVSRSALIREALQEHLKRIHVRESEERDREGYQRYPQTPGDFEVWEKAAAWPTD